MYGQDKILLSLPQEEKAFALQSTTLNSICCKLNRLALLLAHLKELAVEGRYPVFDSAKRGWQSESWS